ncbi:MAG: hypothetical protein GC191_08140 [Azospirillum sp.]|nr:hypothetical protein [Azospirillum sp.]
MAITALVPPTSSALATLEAFLDELTPAASAAGATIPSSEHRVILSLIAAASSQIARHLGRRAGLKSVIGFATWCETIAAPPRTVWLARTPVESLIEVTENGVVVDLDDVDLPDDGEAGELRRLTSGVPGPWRGPLTVTYRAGWRLPYSYTVATIAFAADGTMTDAAKGFGRLMAGDELEIAGSTANSGPWLVQDATHGTVTLTELNGSPATLADEVAGPEITVRRHSTLPPEIERAALILAKTAYFGRARDPLVRREDVPDGGTTEYWVGSVGARTAGLPDDLAGQLAPWRLRAVT